MRSFFVWARWVEIVALLVIGFSVGAVNAADVARGKSIAQAQCMACHGDGGVSKISAYPILAGQHASYLEYTLRAYRNGMRSNPIMASQAAALSEADIEDLAAFFAQQPNGLR